MSTSKLSRSQQRTYDALVNAGIAILQEEGYDALSVTSITQKADYGRGTFYLYFKDKEAFVWTIMRHQVVLLDGYIAQSVGHLLYPEREIRAWEIIFSTIKKQARFWRQLDGQTSQQLRQKQRQLLLEQFEQNLREGRYRLPIDVSPELGARFLVGAAQEILEYWLQNPDIGDAYTMAQLFCRLIYRV